MTKSTKTPHDDELFICRSWQAYVRRVLYIEDKGLCCALLAAKLDPFDWMARPLEYVPVLLFDDTPKVRNLIREYNSGIIPTDTPEYIEAAEYFDDTVAAYMSFVAETIPDYVDAAGNLIERPESISVKIKPLGSKTLGA